MDSKIIKGADDEAKIQKRIIARLQTLGYFVKPTHGNEFQSGFPDLFAAHKRFGIRWIEVKKPDYQSFTEAQLRDFQLMSDNGAGIWVLTAEDDWEINKLYKYQNWWTYLQVAKRHTKWRNKNPRGVGPSKIAMKGPEWDIQEAGQKALEGQGWFVKNTNGNIYQYGFPDQFATHKKYGQRWIEYKNPDRYAFTPAQIDIFPEFNAAGVGVWICNDPLQLPDLLFTPQNWRSFL